MSYLSCLSVLTARRRKASRPILARSTNVAALFLACAAMSPAAARDEPIAQIDTGRIQGVSEPDVLVFRGIPYAAPPVGDGRWRAPAPAAAWPGVRAAIHYGAACPQATTHQEAWAQVGAQSEDCLFLNVWRPARPGAYPVMVFLHGGGFTYGAAGVPLYDGANLARRGVVVVTINYRLGQLGFFAHPALTAENPNGPLGNYGIMDQIAALRWVRRNIAGLGGDAHNVTLFGESAGAGSVQLLMGSPAAAGLFDKAISESGSGGTPLFPIRGAPVSAEALGWRIATAAGLKNATAAQLRALPIDKLLGRGFPFVDGHIVVASPGAPFARKLEAKIPLMIGANSNESSLPSNNDANAQRVLGDRYGTFAKAYAAARPNASPEAARADLAEDALSVLWSNSLAALHAANGAPAYSYYFDQVPANRRAGSAGTKHGDELEYLFGNPEQGWIWDQADRRVSATMAGYWVQFARSGNPNGAGAPAWPAAKSGQALQYLVIGTPTHGATLTPLEEAVRTTALATATEHWTAEK